ncbi:MAG: hypothetical protein HYX69_13270 [Planctomycetia bacterium]|nr:hypothetical protein [Planctomycetia bacterium]
MAVGAGGALETRDGCGPLVAMRSCACVRDGAAQSASVATCKSTRVGPSAAVHAVRMRIMNDSADE